MRRGWKLGAAVLAATLAASCDGDLRPPAGDRPAERADAERTDGAATAGGAPQRPPRAIRLSVVDATTGAPCGGAVCGVRDATTGRRTLAREDGMVVAAGPGPLVAFGASYGYETATVPVGASDEIRLELAPCRDRATVALDGAVPAGWDVKCRISTVTFVAPGGPDDESNVLVQYVRDVPMGEAAVEVPLPARSKTRVYPKTPRGIVWPACLGPAAGESHTVFAERLRDVSIRLASGDAAGRSIDVELLRDRTSNPAGGPLRAAALAWHMCEVRRRWYGVERDGAGLRISGVPECSLHAFVRVGDDTWYVDVAPGRNEYALARRSPSTAWVPKSVEGADLEDVCLLPGRLALSTVLAIRSGNGPATSCAAVRRGTQGPIEDPAIPYAPVVTVVSSARGVAYVPWDATEIRAGDWAVGSIEVVPPDGYEVRGRLLVRSSWRGGNAILYGDDRDAVRFDVHPGGPARLDRLPPGTYCVTGDLTIVAPGGEWWKWKADRTLDVGGRADGCLRVPFPGR